MSFQNKLFTSLVGNNVEKVSDFNAIQNEALDKVFSSKNIPLIDGFSKVEKDKNAFQITDDNIWKETNFDKQYFPLTLIVNGDEFTLPYEPTISIASKNIITKRNVAKSGVLEGTIKEHWSRDDYEISISGILMNQTMMGDYSQCFPIGDFNKLLNYLKNAGSVEVKCELLQLIDVTHIVIEDFSFPFTQGENVQQYEIKAYSDHATPLLLSAED